MLHDDRTGSYKSPVIQTDSAVVYTNGSYEGLNTVIDVVDEEAIDRYATSSAPNLVTPLIPGGDLFKANIREAIFILHDEIYMGFNKIAGTLLLGTERAFAVLKEFFCFLNSSTYSDLSDLPNGFSSRASVDSYYGWWYFTSFIAATDSMNKNAFHYKEPGGLWFFFSWDLNASFGQRYDTKHSDPYFSTKIRSLRDWYSARLIKLVRRHNTNPSWNREEPGMNGRSERKSTNPTGLGRIGGILPILPMSWYI